jgi:hypothetical protein
MWSPDFAYKQLGPSFLEFKLMSAVELASERRRRLLSRSLKLVSSFIAVGLVLIILWFCAAVSIMSRTSFVQTIFWILGYGLLIYGLAALYEYLFFADRFVPLKRIYYACPPITLALIVIPFTLNYQAFNPDSFWLLALAFDTAASICGISFLVLHFVFQANRSSVKVYLVHSAVLVFMCILLFWLHFVMFLHVSDWGFGER